MMTLAAALTIGLLNGCATTSGAAPQESRSGFDGARIVSISGHGNACREIICTGLGAQWSSKWPEAAILQVYVFNEYRGITSARLAIDGQEGAPLTQLPGLTQFSTTAGVRQSQASFSVPLQTLRKVASARKAWVRVGTTAGLMDTAVVDGSTDSKALHALRRFLAQVDGAAVN